jgi:hypothetical protein
LQDEPAKCGHGREPEKAAPEKCQSSNIAEEEITQPPALDILTGK